MIDLKYIFKEKDSFIVCRNFDGEDYYFGEFSNLDDAIAKRDLIDSDGWPIPVNPEYGDKNVSSNENLTFSFKVGSSYKHGFLVLTRSETEDLIPKLPYETECDVVLDDIHAKIKLNVLLRLVITKGNDELRNHLKNLSDIDSNQRMNIKLILNKEKDNPLNMDNLIKENEMLKEKLSLANKKISDLTS